MHSASVSRRSAPITLHRFMAASITPVGELEFGGTAATAELQSDGYALSMDGGDISRLKSGHAPLLWMHKQDHLIGRILTATATARALEFRATFPSTGTNALADEKRKLVKDGILRGVSLGFVIDEWEPIQPGNPKAGRRATRWTALEVSLCPIPVDSSGMITERARRATRSTQMNQAIPQVDAALEEHRALGRHSTEITEASERLDQHRSRAGTALRDLKSALQSGDQDKVAECHQRCMRSMNRMRSELKAIGDRQSDALDAHSAMVRSLGAVDDMQELAPQVVADGGNESANTSRGRRQRDLAVFEAVGRGYELEQ
jgi:hypothetical protein